jgi:hypothetical protein
MNTSEITYDTSQVVSILHIPIQLVPNFTKPHIVRVIPQHVDCHCPLVFDQWESLLECDLLQKLVD